MQRGDIDSTRSRSAASATGAEALVIFPWDVRYSSIQLWDNITKAAEPFASRGYDAPSKHLEASETFVQAVRHFKFVAERTYPKGAVRRPSRVSYDALKEALRDRSNEGFTINLARTVLPWMARVLLEATTVFEKKLLRLTQIHSAEADKRVVLTQVQVATLMVMAAFSCIPLDNFDAVDTRGRPLEMPYYNFDSLYSAPGPSSAAKTRCVLEYFTVMARDWDRVKAAGLVIEFTRHYRPMLPDTEAFLTGHAPLDSRDENNATRTAAGTKSLAICRADLPLSPLEYLPNQPIEMCDGMLQSDFANQFIGGGVLRYGCVQEEIRFVVSPELLVSLLLCERMLDEEAITICGCAQYCDYEGYADSFRFKGPMPPTKKIIDVVGGYCIRDVTVVAFDAINFHRAHPLEQFTPKCIHREFVKSFAAFSGPSTCMIHHAIETSQEPRSIATGNWGCGVFAGNHALKFLIQWMAASLARRKYVFCAFGSPKQMEGVVRLHEGIDSMSRPPTVGAVYSAITRYYPQVVRDQRLCFVDFVLSALLEKSQQSC